MVQENHLYHRVDESEVNLIWLLYDGKVRGLERRVLKK